MPVWNNISGVWSTSVDWGQGTWWLMNQLQKQYSLEVSPTQLMSGTPGEIINSIGKFNSEYTVDGPMLFLHRYSADAIGAPRWDGVMGDWWYDSFGADAYAYAQLLLMWMSDYYLVTNLNFNISEEGGARTSVKWFLDPPPWIAPITEAGLGASGYPGYMVPYSSLVSPYISLQIPLRAGQWYDFVVKYFGSYYVPARSVDVTFQITPEDYTPLGGTDIWRQVLLTGSSQIAGSLEYGQDVLMHTPIKMFQGVGINVKFEFLIIPHETSILWGRAQDALGWAYGVSAQNHDIGILDMPTIGVYDAAFQQYEMLSGLFVNPFGTYITNVDAIYKPGICSANVQGRMPMWW